MCPPTPEPTPATSNPLPDAATPTPMPPSILPGQAPGQRPTGALSPPQIPGVELIEAIGRGGFAIVYRAHQRSVDRDVAVKIEQFQLTEERDRRRFEREITAAGRVSAHPHIVSLFDGGLTSDGRPYLVMELCPGGSLANRMSESGPLSASEVIDVGIGIADALQAAHNAGILHRDVKPANILITQYGTPALTDFGVAALPREVTLHSMTLASLTPSYAPPEAFDLKPPTPSADIYALGATLYALLRGSPPRWTADGPPALPVLLEQIRYPLPALPDVDPDLMRVIWAATAPDPQDRWTSAADLGQALRLVRSGQSPHCPPGGLPLNPGIAPPAAPTETGYGLPTPNTSQTHPPAGQVGAPAAEYGQHTPNGPRPPGAAGRAGAPQTWPPQATPGSAIGPTPGAPGQPTGGEATPNPYGYQPAPPRPAPTSSPAPRPEPQHTPNPAASSPPLAPDRPSSPGGGGRRTKRRARLRWMSLVALIAVVGVLGTYVAWDQTRAKPNTGTYLEPTEQNEPTTVSMPDKTGSYKRAGENECWRGMVNSAGKQVARAVQSCAEEHYWETYAEGELSADADTVDLDTVKKDSAVKETCTADKLQRYVGTDIDSYSRDVLPPSESRFASGDRHFYCVAAKGSEPVTGSFKDDD